MGANPTQARAVCLCFVGFILISAGLAANFSVIALAAGFVMLGVATALFLKCKPWEHNEE
jgi:hypothetical protein